MFSRILLLFILGTFLVAAQSQQSDSTNKYLYFSQKEPGTIPDIFAPDIISSKAFEFGGTFSPDGKEYFFTRRPDNEGSDNRIYYTKLNIDGWTKPGLAPFALDIFEFIPAISPDGKLLFFYSNRPKPDIRSCDGNICTLKKRIQDGAKQNILIHRQTKNIA